MANEIVAIINAANNRFDVPNRAASLGICGANRMAAIAGTAVLAPIIRPEIPMASISSVSRGIDNPMPRPTIVRQDIGAAMRAIIDMVWNRLDYKSLR